MCNLHLTSFGKSKISGISYIPYMRYQFIFDTYTNSDDTDFLAHLQSIGNLGKSSVGYWLWAPNLLKVEDATRARRNTAPNSCKEGTLDSLAGEFFSLNYRHEILFFGDETWLSGWTRLSEINASVCTFCQPCRHVHNVLISQQLGRNALKRAATARDRRVSPFLQALQRHWANSY